MTDTLEMPPPPPEKPDRSKYWKWGAIGVGALFVISLVANNDSTESPSPAAAPVTTVQRAASPAPTTTQRRITESDLQMMTLDATGLESFIRNDVCPTVRDLLREGYRRADIIELAVQAFEDGFGERLYPEPRARFVRALDAC